MSVAATMKGFAKPARARKRTAGATRLRWWQWLLLYPTALGALLTAVPGWIDKGRALYFDVRRDSYADALKQQALWRRNIDCASQPFAWHSNPRNVRVNATTCPSGDVFVRVSTPDNRQFYEWVDLDRITGADASSLIPQARAATPSATFGSLRPPPAQSGGARLFRAAYEDTAEVVCNRFLDERRLLRHIRTPQGCFDEIVDTLSGAVVERVQVPCRAGC